MRICETRSVRVSALVLFGLFGFAPSVWAAVSVNVGSATGSPGSTVTFFVTVTTTAGEQVAATDTTIVFESATPIVQCSTNPSFAISECALQPTGCTPGVDCQQTKCIVAPFGGTIPSGSQLYACSVHIAANAAGGEYALHCSAVGVFDSAGNSLNPQCTDGWVEVVPPTSQSYTVCDVNRATSQETGDDVGDFGDGSIDIFDYKAIFNAAQLSIDAPAAGTARFSAMDSSTVDAPPACGGDGTLDIFDVRQCFDVGQLGVTNYVRTGTGSSCTSAVQPQ
ncbi:MAG: hypothetical protein ABSA52_04760 [Candidatus Binatia bacterium]|jgi:hypothetical protein